MVCCPCIWRTKPELYDLKVSVTSLESTSTLSTETSQSSTESTNEKQGCARKIFRWCFWRNKRKVDPAAFTESSTESSEKTPEFVPLRLLAGSSPGKNLKVNMKSLTSHTEKRAERKEVSVDPTPKPPGMKHKGVKESEAQVGLKRFIITALTVERNNTTPHGQGKKTAAKKDMSIMLNMKKAKTTKVSSRPSFKLPTLPEEKMLHIPTESSLQTSAMSNVMEDTQMMMLHNQERKEERKSVNPYYWENRMEKLIQDLNKLAFFSDVQMKKSVTDSDAFSFSSKSMMSEGKTQSAPLTPCDTNSQTSASFDRKWHSSDSSDKNSMTSVALSSIPENQLLLGGLRNFGSNCYVNASLQCLLTAEAFCEELSYLLDNSRQNIEDTFLRCFVELWKLRKGFKPQCNMDTLLLDIIGSATDINPEFTINNQNDAHEFLCHCLTQIEEYGRLHGWKEDSFPRCPVKNNFLFKMRNIITCSSCGFKQKNKVEVFNHFSLPLVNNSVNQCFYDTVNKTTEVESKCKECGAECASSRWMFHTLPRFLIMQLNRFTVTKYHTVVKTSIPMDIQPELLIGNYLPQSDTPRSENSKAEDRETNRKNLRASQRDTVMDECGPTSTYRLISVLSHVGPSAEYGHYLSDCSSHSPQQWITYNDHLVTPTTEEDVLRKRSYDAYVLLYEKVSTG